MKKRKQRLKRLVAKGQLNEDGILMANEMQGVLSPFFRKYLKEYDRHDLECLMMKEVTYTSAMVMLHLRCEKDN